MKTLIVEDDLVARFLVKDFLSEYGPCDMVADGEDAVAAFGIALEKDAPYDLICMDILMPRIDGHEALQRIRAVEKARGIKGSDEVKVIMITALDDAKNVMNAYYRGGATSYIVKPIDKAKLIEEIRLLGLIKKTP
jgi:two-component system, chemotaxis family, chemotaxis protein CheY